MTKLGFEQGYCEVCGNVEFYKDRTCKWCKKARTHNRRREQLLFELVYDHIDMRYSYYFINDCPYAEPSTTPDIEIFDVVMFGIEVILSKFGGDSFCNTIDNMIETKQASSIDMAGAILGDNIFQYFMKEHNMGI